MSELQWQTPQDGSEWFSCNCVAYVPEFTLQDANGKIGLRSFQCSLWINQDQDGDFIPYFTSTNHPFSIEGEYDSTLEGAKSKAVRLLQEVVEFCTGVYYLVQEGVIPK